MAHPDLDHPLFSGRYRVAGEMLHLLTYPLRKSALLRAMCCTHSGSAEGDRSAAGNVDVARTTPSTAARVYDAMVLRGFVDEYVDDKSGELYASLPALGEFVGHTALYSPRGVARLLFGAIMRACRESHGDLAKALADLLQNLVQNPQGVLRGLSDAAAVAATVRRETRAVEFDLLAILADKREPVHASDLKDEVGRSFRWNWNDARRCLDPELPLIRKHPIMDGEQRIPGEIYLSLPPMPRPTAAKGATLEARVRVRQTRRAALFDASLAAFARDVRAVLTMSGTGASAAAAAPPPAGAAKSAASASAATKPNAPPASSPVAVSTAALASALHSRGWTHAAQRDVLLQWLVVRGHVERTTMRQRVVGGADNNKERDGDDDIEAVQLPGRERARAGLPAQPRPVIAPAAADAAWLATARRVSNLSAVIRACARFEFPITSSDLSTRIARILREQDLPSSPDAVQTTVATLKGMLEYVPSGLAADFSQLLGGTGLPSSPACVQAGTAMMQNVLASAQHKAPDTWRPAGRFDLRDAFSLHPLAPRVRLVLAIASRLRGPNALRIEAVNLAIDLIGESSVAKRTAAPLMTLPVAARNAVRKSLDAAKFRTAAIAHLAGVGPMLLTSLAAKLTDVDGYTEKQSREGMLERLVSTGAIYAAAIPTANAIDFLISRYNNHNAAPAALVRTAAPSSRPARSAAVAAPAIAAPAAVVAANSAAAGTASAAAAAVTSAKREGAAAAGAEGGEQSELERFEADLMALLPHPDLHAPANKDAVCAALRRAGWTSRTQRERCFAQLRDESKSIRLENVGGVAYVTAGDTTPGEAYKAEHQDSMQWEAFLYTALSLLPANGDPIRKSIVMARLHLSGFRDANMVQHLLDHEALFEYTVGPDRMFALVPPGDATDASSPPPASPPVDVSFAATVQRFEEALLPLLPNSGATISKAVVCDALHARGWHSKQFRNAMIYQLVLRGVVRRTKSAENGEALLSALKGREIDSKTNADFRAAALRLMPSAGVMHAKTDVASKLIAEGWTSRRQRELLLAHLVRRSVVYEIPDTRNVKLLQRATTVEQGTAPQHDVLEAFRIDVMSLLPTSGSRVAATRVYQELRSCGWTDAETSKRRCEQLRQDGAIVFTQHQGATYMEQPARAAAPAASSAPAVDSDERVALFLADVIALLTPLPGQTRNKAIVINDLSRGRWTNKAERDRLMRQLTARKDGEVRVKHSGSDTLLVIPSAADDCGGNNRDNDDDADDGGGGRKPAASPKPPSGGAPPSAPASSGSLEWSTQSSSAIGASASSRALPSFGAAAPARHLETADDRERSNVVGDNKACGVVAVAGDNRSSSLPLATCNTDRNRGASNTDGGDGDDSSDGDGEHDGRESSAARTAGLLARIRVLEDRLRAPSQLMYQLGIDTVSDAIAHQQDEADLAEAQLADAVVARDRATERMRAAEAALAAAAAAATASPTAAAAAAATSHRANAAALARALQAEERQRETLQAEVEAEEARAEASLRDLRAVEAMTAAAGRDIEAARKRSADAQRAKNAAESALWAAEERVSGMSTLGRMPLSAKPGR